MCLSKHIRYSPCYLAVSEGDIITSQTHYNHARAFIWCPENVPKRCLLCLFSIDNTFVLNGWSLSKKRVASIRKKPAPLRSAFQLSLVVAFLKSRCGNIVKLLKEGYCFRP